MKQGTLVIPRVGHLRGMLCVITKVHNAPPRRFEVVAVTPPSDAFKHYYHYLKPSLDVFWLEAEVVNV